MGIEALLREKEKKAELKLVPTGKPQEIEVVNHELNNAVDQKLSRGLTTDESAVNNATTDKENVNKITAENSDSGKQSNKITTNENVMRYS